MKLSIFFSLLLSGASIAQESKSSEGREESPEASRGGALIIEGPCHSDFQKFCPDTKPGDGHFHECLKNNHENFSEVCKGHLKSRHERREARKERRHMRHSKKDK